MARPARLCGGAFDWTLKSVLVALRSWLAAVDPCDLVDLLEVQEHIQVVRHLLDSKRP